MTKAKSNFILSNPRYLRSIAFRFFAFLSNPLLDRRTCFLINLHRNGRNLGDIIWNCFVPFFGSVHSGFCSL